MAATSLLYIGAFAANFYISVVRQNERDDHAVADVLQEQYQSYSAKTAELTEGEMLLAALSDPTAANRAGASRLLYDFSNEQAIKAYFALTSADGQVVCSNFTENNQTVFATASFTSSAISRMEKSPSEVLCFICSVSVTQDQSCNYTFCRSVTGPGGETRGYLFFNLRTEGFQTLSRSIGEDLLITDHYDNVVYTTLDQEEDPQDKLPSGKYFKELNQSGIIQWDGAYYFVSAQTLQPRNLHVITLTPLQMQLQMLCYGGLLFLLLVALLLIVVSIMTRAFTQANSREIGELIDAVEALGRGDGAYQLSPRTSEEFQQLYETFRKGTARLQEVMAHNTELTDRRRQMEIKQLEEQFNPHFVFNIMETVRFQIAEDPETASDMLVSFANLMRYSINYGRTKVTVETDIEYVNDYLLLQKIRYNQHLSWSFSIPDALMECRIPKLLLQPVIENSIKHGYRPGFDLSIRVSAERVGEDLRFTVEDDGAGILPERLAAINESFQLELDSGMVKHIGLYNIQKTLSLLYGARYGIRVESHPGQGTRVILTMPYEIGEDIC